MQIVHQTAPVPGLHSSEAGAPARGHRTTGAVAAVDTGAVRRRYAWLQMRTRDIHTADLDELHALALRLAAEASRIHQEGVGGALDVNTKSSPSDFVSDVDKRAEARLMSMLAEARPDDAILAEEGHEATGSSGVRWIIDPLDGTTNYLHGYPVYAASVAVEVDGEPAIGVVSESPTGRVFSAIRGRGATCGGRPLAVSRLARLEQALVAVGFSYSAAVREWQGRVLTQVIGRVADVRRGGAAALDLCRVAAGEVDAYFEVDLSPWDYAAGSIIVEEAGGRVLEVPAAGRTGPGVAAANGVLFDELLALLSEAGGLPPALSGQDR